MPKPRDEHPLQKHTLNLFEGDFDRIGEMYPDYDTSVIIRRLVHNFISERTPLEDPKIFKEIRL